MKLIISLFAAIFLTTNVYSQTHFFPVGSSSNPEEIWSLRYIRAKVLGSGFILHSSASDKDGYWGGHWYGLGLADFSKLDMKMSGASGNKPVALNGFYGIGFRTNYGKSAYLRNGIFVIGATNADINNLRVLPASHTYKLYVKGGIRSESYLVDLQSSWPDYVFHSDYKLRSIYELKTFIAKNKHLPSIPTAEQIAENGYSMPEMDKLLTEKIEELFLYVIELKKEQDLLIEQINKKLSK